MRMRRGRLMMLTLLVLALPTAALASSMDNFNTGTFQMGSITCVNASQGLNTGGCTVNLVGTMQRFRAVIAGLTTGCNTMAAGTCTFPSGTLEVFNPGGSTPIFTTSLVDGMITKTATIAGGATGSLTADIGCCHELQMSLIWRGTTLQVGSVGATVPEPSALEGLLLGTGILGLAGMMRRKLRLGT